MIAFLKLFKIIEGLLASRVDQNGFNEIDSNRLSWSWNRSLCSGLSMQIVWACVCDCALTGQRKWCSTPEARILIAMFCDESLFATDGKEKEREDKENAETIMEDRQKIKIYYFGLLRMARAANEDERRAAESQKLSKHVRQDEQMREKWMQIYAAHRSKKTLSEKLSFRIPNNSSKCCRMQNENNLKSYLLFRWIKPTGKKRKKNWLWKSRWQRIECAPNHSDQIPTSAHMHEQKSVTDRRNMWPQNKASSEKCK